MTQPLPREWEADARSVIDPDARGPVRLLGGPGTGKSQLLVDAAAARIAAGFDPESVLLLCGAARAAARSRAALTGAWPRSGGRTAIREPLVRSVHSYAFAVLRLAAQRTGDPPPRLVTGTEQEGIIGELLAGDLEDGQRAAVAWPESLRPALAPARVATHQRDQLARCAARGVDPPPRLVTGTEQEGIIGELLAGDLEDGQRAAVAWPESLRPALATAGFATQLRDLLARCAERGVDPVRLQHIGRQAGRPEWVAAGQFAQQYEQVMLLRAATGMAAPQATVPALGAAELVGAALEAFASDPGLLAAERRRVRVLLVDDAQHFDPQAARLVRALAAGAARTVIAGDPNQTVFGFRGADPALLDVDAAAVTLTRSYRCAPAVARAVSTVAARLPGHPSYHEFDGAAGDPGCVSLRLAASPHAEAALAADTLRRAHLIDGVPWSQMAVIVRSLPRAGAVLPRALAAAGVPVATPPQAVPPAELPPVRALLTVLAATAAELGGDQALELLTGPIGRVDPVSLRRLRRVLRRRAAAEPPRDFGRLLVDVLIGDEDQVPTTHAGPLRRVRAVLDAAACADLRDPRYPLWQAWSRSGLQQRWLTASARGGAAGTQADRDLDSLTALFDIADEYVSRTAGATVRGLVDHVRGLKLPPTDREPLVVPDAVSVVSAHAALGREWDVVVIAGLQEGLWPNTVPRDGVLGTQQLLDRLDGVIAPVSNRAPVLADERRLLVAALGRARRRLLITAVDGDSGSAAESAMPSAFFYELAEWVDDTATAPQPAPRVLSPAAVVGRLRSLVCAPPGAVDDGRRRGAARQLARLAEAGVPGADPASWYGMAAVSSDEPLHRDGRPVTLSPSALQTLYDCPLRWLLERHGGTDGRDLRSTAGSVLHALIADSARSESQLLADLEKAWATIPFDSQWYSRSELSRYRAMLAAFARWRAQTRHELAEVGTEVDVDGVLTHPDPGLPDVRVRGRIDRLERDGAGRIVVVDVKTGKSPASKDDAARHAQLAIYQLAVAAGLVPPPDADPACGEPPGGGRLVYVAKTGAGGPVERHQDALTAEMRREWQDVMHRAAATATGPLFLARANDGCRHCPVRSGCPAQGVRP